MKKRTLTLILAALTALSAFVAVPAAAESSGLFTSGDWCCFVADDGTAAVCRYVGTDTDVTIPRELDGHTVTKLTCWSETDNSYEGIDDVISTGLFSGSPAERVTIPDTVTVIGDGAFFGDGKLKSVTIPDSVTEIGGGAFKDCAQIAELTFPDSVTRIGMGAVAGTAFYNDESNWEGGVLYCGHFLVGAKTDISGALTIKKGTLAVSEWVFCGCRGLESVTFPDSVREISYYAFAGCTSLKSVKLPKNLKKIGAGAFQTCESLEGITIPDGVTEIGDGAFRSCILIDSFDLPDSVRSVGNYVFDNTPFYENEDNWENGNLYVGRHLIELRGEVTEDYSIKPGTVSLASRALITGYPIENLTFHEGLKHIGELALSNCLRMKTVVLPASLESIGCGAFSGCTALETVCYAGTEEQWNKVEIDKGLNEPLLRAKIVFGYPEPAPLDFNGDEKINARDVVGLMKAIVELRVTADAADITGDGKVNARDVISLMKYIVENAGKR